MPISRAEEKKHDEAAEDERHEMQWRQSLAVVGAVDHYYSSPSAAWGELATKVSLFEDLFPAQEDDSAGAGSTAGGGGGDAGGVGGAGASAPSTVEWSVGEQRALHYNEQQLELSRRRVETLTQRVRLAGG